MDRYWRRLRVAAAISDWFAAVAAYGIATVWWFGPAALSFPGIGLPPYPPLILGVGFLTVALGWQFGVYRRWALISGHRVYPLLLTLATYGVVAVIVLSYFVQASPFMAREWLLSSWALSGLFLIGSHLTWRQIAIHWRKRGLLVRRVLIAGANQQGIAVAHQLNDPSKHGTLVQGFLDDYQRPGTEVVDGLKVVGHPAQVLQRAAELGSDEVIIIAGALAWDSQRMLAEMVTRPDTPIEARISPTYYDLLTTSAELSEIGYVPMLTLRRTRLSGFNAWLKALADRMIAALLLLLLTPSLVFWRFKAWWRGIPMLEREPVLGLGAQSFTVLALNPALSDSPVFARLPALWNVLRQDLSLVGPRPIHALEVTSHERWLANLFAMRPGLTGFWRLRGESLPFEERVALDLYYIRNYTPNLDLQILFNTVKQLLRRSLGREDGLARWNGVPSHPARAVAPLVGASPDQATRADQPRPAPPPVEAPR